MLGKYLSFIVACYEETFILGKLVLHEMYPKRIKSASMNRLDETV